MVKRFYFKKGPLILFLFGIMLTGCQKKMIPSTNIPQTKENKEIVLFLEKYKSALERRSVNDIMELIAKDFSDNRGSEDPNHVIGYIELKDYLEKYFPRIKDIRLALFVQHAKKIDKSGIYEVVFYFDKHILTNVPAGEKWVSVKEVNKMIIRRIHRKDGPDTFEILKGI